VMVRKAVERSRDRHIPYFRQFTHFTFALQFLPCFLSRSVCLRSSSPTLHISFASIPDYYNLCLDHV
jgi:hypothetical protein